MDAYHGLEVFRHSLLFLILILSAYTDLSYGKLYNWYTIPGILLGILCNLLQGHLLFHSWWNPLVIQSLIGFGVGFLLFFFLFLSGGFGAGDMKLAGAIGAIMGWYFLLNALVYISLIGAIMAMAVLIWHGKLGWGIQESLRIIFGGRKKGEKETEKESSKTSEEVGQHSLSQETSLKTDHNKEGSGKEEKNIQQNNKEKNKEKKDEEKPLTIPYGFAIAVGSMWAYFLEFIKNF